jgi:DNA-binding transcriptional MerR regulator
MGHEGTAVNKAPDAFRTISEVADELDLPQHVLRFWESRFAHIKPMKRGGGRRYYRRDDVDLLRGIRHLLYAEGYTIRGVQRILREQGVRTVQAVGQGRIKISAPANGDDEGAERLVVDPELPLSADPAAQPKSDAPGDQGAPGPALSPTEAAVLDNPAESGAANRKSRLALADLDRLRQVVSELEACRRLLDGD